MPKVAYSEAEKAQVREALLTKGLELLAKQGIQHTTVEQIYKAVGLSRTFFYSFFSTKESLIIEALYLQQPRVLVYAQKLMDAPSLSWREAVTQDVYKRQRLQWPGRTGTGRSAQMRAFLPREAGYRCLRSMRTCLLYTSNLLFPAFPPRRAPPTRCRPL